MANLIFSQKSVGAKVFSGRLQNISDPDAPVDLSLDGADSFFVLFRSPTGLSRWQIGLSASVRLLSVRVMAPNLWITLSAILKVLWDILWI